jgi:hypothetical protein
MLPNCLVSPDPFSMPTLAKLLQDSPDSPMDHAPVATTPDERPESPVDVDDDKHVQLTVANQGSLRLVSKLFGARNHITVPES